MRPAVHLETGLFDEIRQAAVASEGSKPDLRTGLSRIVADATVFGDDAGTILARLDDAFDLDALLADEFWPLQQELVKFLQASLGRGLESLEEFVPDGADGASIDIHLLPGFTKSYGPTEGVQIFALHPDSDPEEALLFLLHVCYHEASSTFYSEASRIASASPDRPDRFRHWLLLLIQNEGIANFAVLDRLLALRRQDRAGRYFTYAPMIGRAAATSQAMAFCRRTLTDLDLDSVGFLRTRMNEVLKNPNLPVIPLVGIHLAVAIATSFGRGALADLAGREPMDFFSLYARTNDELMPQLFGPNKQDAAAFGLNRGSD